LSCPDYISYQRNLSPVTGILVAMNKILAFVGMPGSGKGTCTDYLESQGFPVVHFGNMLYEEVQRRGLDNVKDEKFVRSDMREKEGKAVFAVHAANKADSYFTEGQEVVVFDGLYSWSEYKYLQEKYGENLIVIAMITPRQERYERILNRKDSHRKYTSVEQIIAREIEEIEQIEKGGPIAMADYFIPNATGVDGLLAQLNQLLNQLQIPTAKK